MPSPLGQLALVVELGVRDVALVPAAVLFGSEHGGPEALHVVARFRVDALHFAQEEVLQDPLVELLWVPMDGFASDGEDGAGLESDRVGGTVVAKVVEEVFEVLCRGLHGSLALEDALLGGPLGPAGVFLPWDPVPKVEELHGTVRKGSDPSGFGVEGNLLHFHCGQVGVIIHAALGEEGDILEAVVVVDDMVHESMPFAANVLESLHVEAEFGRVLGAAFGVDLAVSNDRLEPAKVFAVMSDDDLNLLGIKSRGRGGSPRRE